MSTITRFTDDGDEMRVMQMNEDGTWQAATPMPFYIKFIFRGWKPICAKHKLIFRNEAAYEDHYTPKCRVGGGEYPASDWAFKLKGYTWA